MMSVLWEVIAVPEPLGGVYHGAKRKIEISYRVGEVEIRSFGKLN
jgi:hypothetical protein